MSRGLPYDSDEGRDYAAAITALMHGEAYAQSARIARDHGGPFAGYEKNREPFLRVIRKHRAALKDIDRTHVPQGALRGGARDVWDECVELGEQHGYRNAQVTVLAPTGTIGFMMDCDTTGVEPDIALVKYKKLVGGGLMKIVNNTVPMALQQLGYSAQQVKEIVEYIDENETIEGAPHLKDAHLPVFDCAFKPRKGNALDPLHGPHQDDGRRAAVPLGRDQQDGQRAEGRDASRTSSRPTSSRGSSARRRSRSTATAASARSRSTRRGTPKATVAEAAAQLVHAARSAASCPTSATRSRTSSTSPATRATSRSASTRTARRARSSW